MTTLSTETSRVKRKTAYAEFDLYTGTLAQLPHPTRKEALRVAKRVWRRAVGRPWPGTWRAGRGNHRSYPRNGAHGYMLVNPGQGWAGIIHDLSHTACDYLTRRKLYWGVVCSEAKLAEWQFVSRTAHHTPSHAALERSMVEHALQLIQHD